VFHVVLSLEDFLLKSVIALFISPMDGTC
jgi:hypothetical protein